MQDWFDNLVDKYTSYNEELHTFKEIGNVSIDDDYISAIVNNKYITIYFKQFNEDEIDKLNKVIDDSLVNTFKVIYGTLPDDLLNAGVKIFPTSLDDLEIRCSECNNIDILSALKGFNKKLQKNNFLIFKIRGLDLKRTIEYNVNQTDDIFTHNFKSLTDTTYLTNLHEVNSSLLKNVDSPNKSLNFIYDELFEVLNDEIDNILDEDFESPQSFSNSLNIDVNYNLSDTDLKTFFTFLNSIKSDNNEFKFLKEILDLTYELVRYNAVMPQFFMSDGNVAHIRWIPALYDDATLNLCKSYYSKCSDDLITFNNEPISKENQVTILISLIMNALIQYTVLKNQITSFNKVTKFNFKLFTAQPVCLKNNKYESSIQNISKMLSVFHMNEQDFSYALFVRDNFDVEIKINRNNSYVELNDACEEELICAKNIYDLFTLYGIKNTLFEKIHLTDGDFIVFIDKIKPKLKYINVEPVMPFEVLKTDISLILDTSLNENNFTFNRINEAEFFVDLGYEKLTIKEFRNKTNYDVPIIKNKSVIYIVPRRNYFQIKQRAYSLSRGFNSNEMLKLILLKDYFGLEFKVSDKLNNLVNANDIYNSPESLTGRLRPYQKIGYSWLIQNIKTGFGSILADDMGLGKTIQVLSTILYMKENNHFDDETSLIIVPPTLLSNWENEIKKFTPELTYYIYHGSGRKFPRDNYDIILTTYGVIRIDLELFLDTKWLLCVIDEAQNIKNPTTEQSKAIKSIDAFNKIALTGTPIENRLSDYWSIFDFVNKGYLFTLNEFKQEYIQPIEKLGDESTLEDLKTIAKPFVLRRLKTDDEIKGELPEKFVNDIYCSLTKKQIKLYEDVLDGLFEVIDDKKGISRRGSILKMLTQLKQVCNHPAQFSKAKNPTLKESGKMELLVDILENILGINEKVIIFTQYVKMGEIIQKLISKKFKENVLFLHGSQSQKEKSNIINTFQEDADYKILVATIKTGGTGLNLTAANNVIHYDLWWNPAVENQSTDRVHRIGQEKDVMVYRFITKGTLEESIDDIIKNKIDLAEKAISNDETFITELSNEELKEILSLRL